MKVNLFSLRSFFSRRQGNVGIYLLLFLVLVGGFSLSTLGSASLASRYNTRVANQQFNATTSAATWALGEYLNAFAAQQYQVTYDADQATTAFSRAELLSPTDLQNLQHWLSSHPEPQATLQLQALAFSVPTLSAGLQFATLPPGDVASFSATLHYEVTAQFSATKTRKVAVDVPLTWQLTVPAMDIDTGTETLALPLHLAVAGKASYTTLKE